MYEVINVETGEVVDGVPTGMLLDESNRKDVLEAWIDPKSKGIIRFVEPSERKKAEKAGILKVRVRAKHERTW